VRWGGPAAIPILALRTTACVVQRLRVSLHHL
jgi:hypothetical protein